MNPELLEETAWGCPLYYTPQKYWPQDKLDSYFGNKTVFGFLRSPYDRVVAVWKGFTQGGVVTGFDFTLDGKTCPGISSWVKQIFADPSAWPADLMCQVQPQAPFFDGP